MLNIGLATFHKAYNYGAFLQCFALYKLLESKYNVQIVDYNCKAIEARYKLIRSSNMKQLIKSLVFFIPRYIRCKKFQKCIADYFQLGSCDFAYDCLIAGSDQIWNLNLTGGYDEVYTLEKFSQVRKISYAASVGDEFLIQENADLFQRILTNIDKVSVREETTQNALSFLTDKQIKVTLDPTMLLTEKEWNQYIKEPNCLGAYIFSYFVIPSNQHFQALSQISERIHLKTLSYSEVPKEKNILKRCYTDGPFEFLSRLKKAELVVTSSFHGTVFSILFHKNFWVMLPEKRGSRLKDLLHKLGLENRIIKNAKDIDALNLNEPVDYKPIDSKLEKLRRDSINWLFEAIGE